jgi:hypothetical protein
MTQVAPIRRPFPCGGGYQDQRFAFAIPADFPAGKCESANDNCVLQIYAHSVEPRTYAICVDFTLTTGRGNATIPLTSNDVRTTQFQRAIHYHDSFDTSHVDSAYSGYRGQQGSFIRDELKAAIQLQSFVGNGGLVPLGNIDKAKAQKMRDEIQRAVKAAEKIAIQRNRAEQRNLDAEARRTRTPRRCFEGEIYGVVNNPNCNRQFTNTYVTNVGYRQIYNQFLPKLLASGLTSYSPKLKDVIGQTPADPFGPFQVNGKPSMVPQGRNQRDAPQPQTPPQLGAGENPALQSLATQTSQEGRAPPPALPSDVIREAERIPDRPVAYNPDDILIRPQDKTPMQREEEAKLSIIAVPAPTTLVTTQSAQATSVPQQPQQPVPPPPSLPQQPGQLPSTPDQAPPSQAPPPGQPPVPQSGQTPPSPGTNPGQPSAPAPPQPQAPVIMVPQPPVEQGDQPTLPTIPDVIPQDQIPPPSSSTVPAEPSYFPPAPTDSTPILSSASEIGVSVLFGLVFLLQI